MNKEVKDKKDSNKVEETTIKQKKSSYSKKKKVKKIF
tara:strand:+ start:687 stop:797 length:111 start_codon:yes stop_codon:yes gene_type:complete